MQLIPGLSRGRTPGLILVKRGPVFAGGLLVVVPLYTSDNPESIAYILGDCGARLLLVGEIGQWSALAPLQTRFPAHAGVPEVWLTLEPWSIENGLITPTMKLKRPELERRFAEEIRKLYAGHDLPA